MWMLYVMVSAGANPCKLECQTQKSQNQRFVEGWSSRDPSGNIPSAEVMIKFWKEVIKPSIFDHVERREQAILRAALCDCLTEIGEAVFSILPQVQFLFLHSCLSIFDGFVIVISITYS